MIKKSLFVFLICIGIIGLGAFSLRENSLFAKENFKNEAKLEITDVEEENSSKKDISIKENVSDYQDESKISANAGLQEITVNNTDEKTEDDDLIFYEINDNNTLSKVSKNSYKEATDKVIIGIENNKIVMANHAIVQTLGGYNTIDYMYPTIEDADNEEHGTIISGGGFDGTYIGSEKYNNEYYIHLIISGYEGYMSVDDVQIIPSNLIQSQSYYENIGGVWTYYEAISPLTENKYSEYPQDISPDWAPEDTKYYSNDDETFYTNNLINEQSDKESKASYSYFQNLPFRSTSQYTAEDYKSYLKHKGYTNSKYYNSTSAFTKSQDELYINSLVLFSMANHEGAYGTSYYSNKCNNFFGRGAFDSNPDNACIEYGYPTASDGILAEAIFLTQNYADIEYWVYHGTEVGNKDHGMNVKYASDPDWGKKIASMMYDTDSYLNGNENNYYRIYEIKNSEPFYSSSSQLDTAHRLKSKPISESQHDYYLPRNDGKNPRVIVTADTSSSFQVQLPTPKNVEGDSYCTWTDAKKGSYPKYNDLYGQSGNYSNPVPKNSSNFACEYSSWESQRGWYPKKDANGSITYNVINNVSAKAPQPLTKIEVNKTYCPDGKTLQKEETLTKTQGKLTDKIVITYDCTTKNKIDYLHESYNLDSSKDYYRHMMYEKDGSIKYDRKVDYNGKGQLLLDNKYSYDSSANPDELIEKLYDSSTHKEIKYINSTYNTNDTMHYYRHIDHEADGSIKYDRKINYGETGIITYDRKVHYNPSGKMLDDYQYSYYDNGKPKQKLNYKYDSNTLKEVYYINSSYSSDNDQTYYRHIDHEADGSIKYDRKIGYNNDGRILNDYKHYYYSNGNFKQTLDYIYDNVTLKEIDYKNSEYNENKTIDYYRHIEHENDASVKYDRKIDYNGNGKKLKDSQYMYYSDGKIQQTKDYAYDSTTLREIDYINSEYEKDGTKTYYRHIQHEADGSIKYDRKMEYDLNGNLIHDHKFYYDSNGQKTDGYEY